MKYFNDVLGKTTLDSGQEIVNILRDVDFSGLLENVHTFEHTIKDGETPDTLAEKYYGNRENWWIIAILNDTEDINHEWPMTDACLKRWYNVLVADGEISPPSAAALTALREENNAKREIVLLKSEYFEDFVFIIKEKLKENT